MSKCVDWNPSTRGILYIILLIWANVCDALQLLLLHETMSGFYLGVNVLFYTSLSDWITHHLLHVQSLVSVSSSVFVKFRILESSFSRFLFRLLPTLDVYTVSYLFYNN